MKWYIVETSLTNHQIFGEAFTEEEAEILSEKIMKDIEDPTTKYMSGKAEIFYASLHVISEDAYFRSLVC